MQDNLKALSEILNEIAGGVKRLDTLLTNLEKNFKHNSTLGQAIIKLNDAFRESKYFKECSYHTDVTYKSSALTDKETCFVCEFGLRKNYSAKETPLYIVMTCFKTPSRYSLKNNSYHFNIDDNFVWKMDDGFYSKFDKILTDEVNNVENNKTVRNILIAISELKKVLQKMLEDELEKMKFKYTKSKEPRGIDSAFYTIPNVTR